MQCPNCNFEMFHEGICPQCKMDSMLVKQTRTISKRLYNQGLYFARAKHLSRAKDILIRSLCFDKTNVDARNLLSLIYFETGHVNLALKEWIISSNFKTENNKANDYIQMVDKNQRLYEKYNSALEKYNLGLKSLKDGSVDIATIQLKKACEENPKLVNAHLLLSLCQMQNNRRLEANLSLEKVLQIDRSNPFAIRYFYELNGSPVARVTKIKFSADQNKKERSFDHLQAKNLKHPFSFSSIATFLAGSLAAFLIAVFLLTPQIRSGYSKQIAELKNKLDKTTIEQQEKLAELQNNYDELEEKHRLVSSELNEFKTIQTQENNEKNLELLKNYIKRNELEEAVKLIENIVESALEDDKKEEFLELKKRAFLNYATFLNKEASKFFNRLKYNEAKEFFEKALLYSESEKINIDSLFYLARIAEIENDPPRAVYLYEKIIQDYPNTPRKATVDAKLKALQEQTLQNE